MATSGNLLATPLSVPSATGLTDARFAAAHRHLLADRSLQFDLPAFQQPQLPGWIVPAFKALGAAWPVLRIGLMIALAVAVVLILRLAWFRLNAFLDRRRDVDEPDWRPEAAPARALLAEADALAAEGDFAAAAHLVLLRSVEQIAERRPGLLGPALTSRDIAALAGIPADVARAFALIGSVVEAGVFGARPVAAAAWERCRAAYADVAFTPAWR